MKRESTLTIAESDWLKLCYLARQFEAQVASNAARERLFSYQDTVYWVEQWKLTSKHFSYMLTQVLEDINP